MWQGPQWVYMRQWKLVRGAGGRIHSSELSKLRMEDKLVCANH